MDHQKLSFLRIEKLYYSCEYNILSIKFKHIQAEVHKKWISLMRFS